MSAICLSLPQPAVAQLANALTGTPTATDEPTLGGFDLELTLSDASGLNAVGENYRNELSVYFEPRWSVGRRLAPRSSVWNRLTLSGRFVLGQALAGTSEEFFGTETRSGPLVPCGNVTPSQSGGAIDPNQVPRCHPTATGRRLDYSDVWITAGVPRLFTIPRAALDVPASLRVVLPASAQSRFQTLRFGLSATTGLARAFWADRLRLSYTLGFAKNFHEYSTPGLDPNAPGTAADVGGNGSSGVSGVGISNLYGDPTRVGLGGFNTSFSLTNGVAAHVVLSQKWSGDVLYLWTDGFTYAHRCAIDVAGQAIDSCRTGAAVAANSGSEIEGRGHRRQQVFWVTASYEFRPWLNFALAWVNWAPREKPDTSYRQGFISTDYNAFTTVMLSATTSMDQIATSWRASQH